MSNAYYINYPEERFSLEEDNLKKLVERLGSEPKIYLILLRLIILVVFMDLIIYMIMLEDY